jgi:hypothetical protein
LLSNVTRSWGWSLDRYSPEQQPAAPAPQKVRERRPEQQRRKQEKTSLESYTQTENAAKTTPVQPAKSENASPETIADTVKATPPRKKHRSRKHGHRKPSGATNDGNKPTPPSSGA